MKNKIIWLMYRMLRNDMVARMRMKEGFTWSKVNTVLKACGQKVIIRVETTSKGQMLTFGQWKNRAEWLQAQNDAEVEAIKTIAPNRRN